MNLIRRILAKLRRRKTKVEPLGRYFVEYVRSFNSGQKIYLGNVSGGLMSNIPTRARCAARMGQQETTTMR